MLVWIFRSYFMRITDTFILQYQKLFFSKKKCACVGSKLSTNCHNDFKYLYSEHFRPLLVIGNNNKEINNIVDHRHDVYFYDLYVKIFF